MNTYYEVCLQRTTEPQVKVVARFEKQSHASTFINMVAGPNSNTYCIRKVERKDL